MKKKNFAVLAVSIVVMVVSLLLIYRYFAKPTGDSSVTVTVPQKINTTFNQDYIDELSKPKDYTPDITPPANLPKKDNILQ